MRCRRNPIDWRRHCSSPSLFWQGVPASLILGDNIFYSTELPRQLQKASARTEGATLFAYHVQDPERYGVLGFDEEGKVQTIVEKPASPASQYAVTGIYFYDGDASKIARTLHPSDRGELEITDVNLCYLKQLRLDVCFMGRSSAWLDTGTHDSLQETSSTIQTLGKRQGLRSLLPRRSPGAVAGYQMNSFGPWHALLQRAAMAPICCVCGKNRLADASRLGLIEIDKALHWVIYPCPLFQRKRLCTLFN